MQYIDQFHTKCQDWCFLLIDFEMNSSLRKACNLIDSQHPLLITTFEGSPNRKAEVYHDSNNDQWILIVYSIEYGVVQDQPKIIYSINDEYGLGHLMHLGEMVCLNDDWFELLQDPLKVDQYSLTDALTDTPDESKPFTFDYTSGEGISTVLHRWSVELNKLKGQVNK